MYVCMCVHTYVSGYVCVLCASIHEHSSPCICFLAANRRLAEMNVELIKAQEHAKRFQEVLAVERRKQKALRVSWFMPRHSSTDSLWFMYVQYIDVCSQRSKVMTHSRFGVTPLFRDSPYVVFIWTSGV